ncbi:unnamed protein product [Aphanomyces euteiches]|nr:hypothetical protein Ae201684P_010432 [Aphanomyces euteiches]
MDLIQLSATYPVATAAALLVLAVAALMLYYFVIETANNPLNLLPGPPSSHWFFGSFKEIIDTKWSDGHFPEPMLSWVKKYGGAVHYRAMLNHRVMLTDPEAIKHVCLHGQQRQLSACHGYPGNLLGGDGLLSTEGETHHHQCKMLMPHFGFAKVREFIGIFARHARQLSQHLKEVADQGVAVDLHDFFTKLTLDIIGVSAFGYNFGSLEDANDRVLEAYKMSNQPVKLFYFLGAIYIPGFANWPLPRLVKQREAKRILLEKVDNVIASKLQAPRDISRPIDLVDLMLDVDTHTEHRVTAEEARTHVVTFMLAGHETTSTTLCWVFAMFATHPAMETIARKECQAVAAASEGGEIGWKSLAELKYTTAFINEALRMYPTVTNVATRVCAADDHVPMSDGKPIFIPKGTHMIVSTGALHRNPKYWSQPNEFLPQRFLEGTAPYEADKALRNGQGNAFTYLPFSTGPKNCIGMRFATAELQVVVSNLLLQFSFRLTDKANIHPKLDGVSMKPVDLTMTIHAMD